MENTNDVAGGQGGFVQPEAVEDLISAIVDEETDKEIVGAVFSGNSWTTNT